MPGEAAAELCPATLGEQGDHLVPAYVESHPSVVSKGRAACAGSVLMESVSGCSEDKAQFYFLVASAQGRGGGVSMTYLVKFTVPRMKGAAESAGS